MTTTEVAAESVPSAEVIIVDAVGLPATHRCDRCGAQAYIEAELTKDRLDLRFCAHHYRMHAEALAKQASRIFDYRQFLKAQERLLTSR